MKTKKKNPNVALFYKRDELGMRPWFSVTLLHRLKAIFYNEEKEKQSKCLYCNHL